jgi:enterochelin esterase-like enzyme
MPSVVDQRLVFRFADTERTYARVSLDCDDAIPGRRRFRRTARGWALGIPRPEVVRVEYRLVLTAWDGSGDVVCDPGNPERVRTAFGDRSVVLLPGYLPPRWLGRAAPQGRLTGLRHDDRRIGELPVTVWSPAGLEQAEPAPLLVVHDGPEYADLAALTTYAAAMVAGRTLPPFRLALMHPVHRDEWYSANPDYVAAELDALDTVAEAFAVSGPLVTLGASLGGLTALLVAYAGGARFAGVVTQSASFFRADLDAQEQGYPGFRRIVEAVRDVGTKPRSRSPLQVAMTCGLLEENHTNNVQMAAVLKGLGHRVRFFGVPDLHNYTAWRDSLDPALTGVLLSVWRTQG